MEWQEEFTKKLVHNNQAQISIDGQIWTARAQGSDYSFSNAFGREEKFSSVNKIVDAIESWYENPTIVVL
ncbi:hypothetical protein DNHGIG_34750 [Collibacillus ludicampi]|uniref:Uncharacterized protein n=1 Tax=Collibacillus ludicampi TaxID=2771369 RepID=A0AAV4LJK9_9BACL|nr:hypothetical protein [Collibacillus ludicampi]GIM47926.1 hypothetical protein DNHGIG_34750 [Collibacillus ludicampi]